MFGTAFLQNAYYLICICLVVLIVKYIVMKFDRNKLSRQGIPGLRLAWHEIMGHISILLRVSVHDKHYSRHTYLLLIFEGLRNLFLSDSIFYGWALHRCYIVLLKADAIEIIQRKKELLKTKADSNRNVQPKRKALMDLLLYNHIADQVFTEEDIREEVDTFAFEGHDTVSAALTWSLYMIGLYPEVQEKIYDELDKIFDGDDKPITNDDLRDLKYLECVIKEVQRLYPSVPIIGRVIANDCTICGYPVKKGTRCLVYVYGLHRDANVFPNPEYFDPERFFPENASGRNPYAYVPFSAGPRNCIGQRFAMMELKVVLASVLRSFSVLSLEPRDKLLPAADLILRPSYPVKMKFTSRKETEI